MADYTLKVPTDDNIEELRTKQKEIDTAIESLVDFSEKFQTTVANLEEDTLDDLIEINGDNIETATNETATQINILQEESARLKSKLEKYDDLAETRLLFEKMNSLKEHYDRKIESITEGESVPDYEGINGVLNG